MPIDRHHECYPAYYERNQRIQSTKTTFFRACNVIPLPAQWVKLLQLGLQLEFSEAELLKLIVNYVNAQKPLRFVL